MCEQVNISEQDTQILARDELHRIPECVNAMSNSSGGVIKPEGESDIHVQALKWYEKPIALNGRVWRRIEGENVICGVRAKSVMACRDSCDDFAVEGAALERHGVGGTAHFAAEGVDFKNEVSFPGAAD